MKAPFPWFGGKRRVASLVWPRFGDVSNYIEPFAGSLAVLLERPHAPRSEIVNDKDPYISNFWRALQNDPDEMAYWADWPVNEVDLHARHRWLVAALEGASRTGQRGGQDGRATRAPRGAFTEMLMSDPHYYDSKIAGWWVWGISQWIGNGWCVRPEWQGRFGTHARGIHGVRANYPRDAGATQNLRDAGATQNLKLEMKRPSLRRGGRGIHGVHLSKPDLSGCRSAYGRGIHASAFGDKYGSIRAYFDALAHRLRRVRVCCGDWHRVLSPSCTTKIGLTAVLLDPPYGCGMDDASRTGQLSPRSRRLTRDMRLYAHDEIGLSARVRKWAIEHGDDPKMRIALCGLEGEHEMPPTWTKIAWKANGGYGNQSNSRGRQNASRERIWFSPHCLSI